MILARVYVGDGAGGPVDYSAPFAETQAGTITMPPLAPGARQRVAVRFFDPATGLEELNTDAYILLVVSGTGDDVSIIPPSPAGLAVRDTGGGSAVVTWQYNVRAGDEVPDAWDVYATRGVTVDYSAPIGSVAHNVNTTRYSYLLTGFDFPGDVVAVAVRSRKGAAHDPNTVVQVWSPQSDPAPATRPTAAVVDYEV